MSRLEEELNFVSPIVRNKRFDLGFRTGFLRNTVNSELLEVLELIIENASKSNIPDEYYLHQIAYDAAIIAINNAKNI